MDEGQLLPPRSVVIDQPVRSSGPETSDDGHWKLWRVRRNEFAACENGVVYFAKTAKKRPVSVAVVSRIQDLQKGAYSSSAAGQLIYVPRNIGARAHV